jgi:hypothetical protein
MGRSQRPLDPAAGPAQAFAAELRDLHARAGSPKFVTMMRRTGRSRTALSEAVGGDHVATWETVAAFVTACGESPREWRERWQLAYDEAQRLRSQPSEADVDVKSSPEYDHSNSEMTSVTSGAGHGPGDVQLLGDPERTGTQPRWWLNRRVQVLAVGVAVVILAVTATVVPAVLRDSDDVPISGTVACPKGAAVVGIWVKIEPRDGSGFASWSPQDTPERARFNYQLPRLTPWTVNVGCGGTLKDWKHSVHGIAFTSALHQDWTCSIARLTYGCRPAEAGR